MMTDEEKKAIEYLKARLYGNKGCKFIDVAQEDLRRIIKLVDIKEKSLKQANDLITEQDEEICKINNEKFELEIKVDKLQKGLDKKDKVIDLMAREINKAYYDKQHFNLFFEGNLDDKSLPKRISKIVNYYTKKVEEEK